MIFATDTGCSYANIVVRKELWDRGVRTVEALADAELVGRKAVVAATAIGSGTYVYGVYVLQNITGADGKPVNDHVEWVGGGASTTTLGGLKAGKFDAIMPVPEWHRDRAVRARLDLRLADAFDLVRADRSRGRGVHRRRVRRRARLPDHPVARDAQRS